ncbi:MAG: polyprenyl synthetase family protein [Dehalobacter sp.]|nr:polyprenyl synthetase family protein [Dehalobacter sp.]
MNFQLDQNIFAEIDRIMEATKLSAEMCQMIQNSLNADSSTGELFKWAYLATMSCECTGGKPETALPGAIAMEFFALAADIFDDIQDQDHDDLPWRKISEAKAISLANCLLMLSDEAISEIQDDRIYREISKTIHRAGVIASDGQFREFLYADCDQISLEQYFEIVKRKSGSLTSCACEIGAILGGASDSIKELLAEFGQNFGIMNQIRNDLNDFLDFQKKHDFTNNIKTLPYVYLLHTVKEVGQFHLRKKGKGYRSQQLLDNEKELLKRTSDEEGVSQYCTVMFEIYRHIADEILERLPVPEKQKEKMKKLVGEIF